MFVTSPPLRLLARRKLAGAWRKQVRRFKTPSGAIFALVGLLVFGFWIASAVIGQLQSTRSGFEPAIRNTATELLLLAGVVLTLVGSLGHRGLYLPKEEVELLLSAPVARADIVRYRLLANFGRSLLGALFVGIAVGARAEVHLFGFLGGFAYTLTLPLLGQFASLLAGDAENRVTKGIARIPGGMLGVATGLLAGVVMALLFGGPAISRLLERTGMEGGLPALIDSPLLRAIGTPMRPWSRMMLALDWSHFLPWLAVCVVIWLALLELTARVPIDFRELSLATSADVAKKLARRRSGGVAGSTSARRAAGWNIPWIFGRSPFGALAWRKTGSIVRKARGTLLTGLAIVVLISLLVSTTVRGDGEQAIVLSSFFIAAFGTLYMTAGLRFDFREDLERMDVVKSWPVAPWRIFLATLLPEVLFVAVLVDGAIVVRAAVTGAWHWTLPILALGVPLIVLLWVALDNAVYLFAPVRYVPGQEGALHQAGRAVVLMLLRVGLLLAVFAGAALPLLGALALHEWAGLPTVAMQTIAILGGSVVLTGETVLLIWLGGRMLARFDVARDRG